MKRCSRIFLLVLFSLFLVATSVWGQNIHVLVNIWDGTQKDVVENLYYQGKLPYLSTIGPLYNLTANEECFNGTCMLTQTKPQHATMLTGCLADMHGVYSNNIYQLIPDGITVYELIEANNPAFISLHSNYMPYSTVREIYGFIKKFDIIKALHYDLIESFIEKVVEV